MSNVPENLKRIRKEKGLSQKALADKLGVSQNAVYNWENGKHKLNPDNMKLIADALDVSVYALYGDDDNTIFYNTDERLEHIKKALDKTASNMQPLDYYNLLSVFEATLSQMTQGSQTENKEYIERFKDIMTNYGAMIQQAPALFVDDDKNRTHTDQFYKEYDKLIKLIQDHKETLLDRYTSKE